MKYILSLIISGALVVSGFGQTRNVLVNTNNAVVQPTNFWSADASNARTGLGLGDAATNPATAFQPSSLVLSNLASSNGVNLTNIPLSGVVGAMATNGDAIGLTNFPTLLLRTNGSASGLTNFPASLLTTNGNGAGLTNLTAANITGTVGLASNVSGVVAIVNGGTGSTNASNARTALGLGTAAISNSSAFQPSSAVLSNLATSNGANLTNIQASNLVGTITTNLTIQFDSITATNGESTFEDVAILDELNAVQATLGTNTNIVIIGSSGISFGSAPVAATTRTNLGLGWPALTNTDATNFRNAISIGTTNEVVFDAIVVSESTNFSSSGINGIQWRNIYPSSNGLIGLYGSDAQGTTTFGINVGTMSGTTAEVALFNASRITFYEPLEFNNTTNAATTRTNLSLGWSALTNDSSSSFQAALFGSNTNPVLVNTNGEVVSPTNFWQVAPIVTRFVEFDPPTNATTNIVAARTLHIHSLAISRTGVTSTIALPTNGVFNGDIALVSHQGPTSSVTAVRTAGSTNDLVTMTRFDEAVDFVYYNGVWQFNHNLAFVEPIYFSGTNAAANAAASRTNLGIPLAALTNTNNANFQAAVFNTNNAPTNAANFADETAWLEITVQTNGTNASFRIPLYK